jgi:tetratricopeptide (TPR) repeat protein
MNLFRAALLAGAALLLPSPPTAPVFARTPASSSREAIMVSGVVRDMSGAAIPGAAVFLQAQAGAASQEAKTAEDGAFSFLVPHPGTYVVRAKMQGFADAVSEPLELSAGEEKQLRLVMKVAPGGGVMVEEAPPFQPSASKLDDIQFNDQPAFTVAGVTDWTAAGGHGSDTKLRISESLARETAAMKSSEPGVASAAAPASSREADSHRAAGDRAEKSGDPLAAEHEYKVAVYLDPSEPNYFAWATELLLHRAVPEAAQVFTRAIEAHPKSPRLLAGLGAALYARGSYADAALRVCEASDLRPADPGPYFFLGKMEQAAPDPLPCVREKLTRFARQQPKNAQANYYLAASLWKRAQRSENSAEIQQCDSLLGAAIKSDPKQDSAYILLGTVRASRADFRGAIDLYKKALKINPQSSEAHYRLSQAYKRTGQQEKAEQEVQLYKQAEKAETDAVERQRREIRQFLIILWDQAQPPPPSLE